MCDCIRCADGKSAVQDTRQEGYAIAPARKIVRRKRRSTPYRGITRMLCWHSGDDNDSDETSDNDEK